MFKHCSNEFKKIEIPGDGNCLFSCISLILYGIITTSEEVRSEICEFITSNWDQFSNFISGDDTYVGNNLKDATSYFQYMSRDKVYGGGPEILAACILYNINITVFKINQPPITFSSPDNASQSYNLLFTGDSMDGSGHFTFLQEKQPNSSVVDMITEESPGKAEITGKVNKIKRKKVKQSWRKELLKKKAATNVFRGSIETSEEKQRRNKQNKENMELCRATVETPDDKENRNAKNKAYMENKRKNESTNESDLRRKRNKTRTAERRTNETAEESHIRRTKDNERSKTVRNKKWVGREKAAFNYDPNVNYANDDLVSIGQMNITCKYCKSIKWNGEAPGLCCRNGKTSLPTLCAPPEPLNSLLLWNNSEAKEFQNNIRAYNSLFQMTSFGTSKQIQEEGFMPSFKVQGQIYHLIGSLLPEQNEEPKFIQIYFISDMDKQAETRQKYIPTTKIETVIQLQEMLHHHNAYVKSFKLAVERVTPNCKIVIDADRVPEGEHRRRFNDPTTSEVAVLLVGEQHEKRDIVLQLRSGNLQRIAETHRAYDSLQYPLIMWQGDDGYHFNLFQTNPVTGEKCQKRISAMDFYSYRFMVRADDFNLMLHYKTLLHQFAVDMYAKIEAERLRYIRLNQKKLRVDEYAHLKDSINNDGNSENLGRLVILPSSFTGSPRYMHEKTQDAITYVRNYGRPSLFITFTCNPKWKDITDNLFEGQKPHDRHDLIARVFHLKIKSLMNVIFKGKIFGSVQCYMYTVEWQKRGLPHVHLLLWLHEKIHMEEVNSIISAELPNSETDPELYRIVTKHMLHGPCGAINPRSPCMKDGKCTKQYPRQFINETQCSNGGYPLYQRRPPYEGGCCATIKVKGMDVDVDNRWVVPYSPILSRMFDSHINVEFCASVKSIKYVCKYVNKGSDMAVFHLKDTENENPQNMNDEIQSYELGRYISTNEAFWRIFNFTVHEHYPPVVHLSVHLENGQRVYFTEEHVEQQMEKQNDTTLTSFFNLCKNDDFAKQLYYYEVPRYYTWNKTNKSWQKRKVGHPVPEFEGIKESCVLGRIYTVHPLNSECFFLRLLLHDVKGPTSFSDLKTFDGTVCETFRQACQMRGLLEDDAHWEKTLEEAAAGDSPKKLRSLFAVMLHVCGISNPLQLWEKFKTNMAEDILEELRHLDPELTIAFTEEIFNKTLILIEDKLRDLGSTDITLFGLPRPNRESFPEVCVEILRETSYDQNELLTYMLENETKLNNEQKIVFDEVTNAVFSGCSKIIFLDAPGGTGKTFLLNMILAKIRSEKKVAIAVASSGIAATLLNGGRTSHSVFQLPLNLANTENATCNISRSSGKAKLLQKCELIIWDECSMSHKSALEALDRTLKDLRKNEELMGGITLLLAGDFRQTLPIVPRGTKADELQSCLKMSYLWGKIQHLHLSTNMRAKQTGIFESIIFSETLLKVGEDKLPKDKSDGTILTTSIGGQLVNTEDELKEFVFPNVEINFEDTNWLSQRCILAPKNEQVNKINYDLLQKIPGLNYEYKSVDTVVQDEDTVNYPVEFLNSIDVSGVPPHILHLKKGVPIILLRNLDPPLLCNGTRLVVERLMTHVIEAMVMTGRFKGERVFIPKIPIIPTDFPFQFKRIQFPVRLCFAMSINKAQGQTMDTVGINLTKPCFAHGQLYVACTRVGNPKNLYILAPGGKTKNIVYSEVFKN